MRVSEVLITAHSLLALCEVVLCTPRLVPRHAGEPFEGPKRGFWQPEWLCLHPLSLSYAPKERGKAPLLQEGSSRPMGLAQSPGSL